MNLKFLFCGVFLMFGAAAAAQDADAPSEARRANLARVDARLAGRRKAHADDARFFVARGVLADNVARTVTLDASTTGVGVNDIAEFFVITENSGHDYEALLMTFAKADDICRAIEFIGVPRGRSVNADKLIFWPKGERLHATATIGDAAPVVLDSLITFADSGRPLEKSGFIYVGDRRNEAGAFIGDDYGPGSVIPTYNEPITVMDVPRKAEQSEVYEKYRVSTSFLSEADMWTQIVLKPEDRPDDSPLRVQEVAFAFSPAGVSLDGGAAIPMKAALESVQALIAAGRDVHTTLRWGDALSLSQIRDYCRVLALVDVDSGIRVEPPMAGDPYYKAFLPQETWRERKNRFTQPCELRVDADGAATVVVINEEWIGDAITPKLTIEEIPGVTPDTVADVIQANGPEIPVVLIFAPGALEYGTLRPYIRALVDTHPNLHVFVEDE